MSTKYGERGLGSIRQRKDGRFEARIYIDGKRKSIFAKSRREVEKKRHEALAAIERGEHPIPQQVTLASYLLFWLKEFVQPKLRTKTYDSYRYLVERHIIAALGNVKLARLTPEDVQRFLNKQLERGLSRTTVSYQRSILRKALNDAMRFGYVHRNVVTLTDSPGTDRKEQRWLEPSEAKRFVSAAQDHRLEALWVIAVTTGLRKGEVLGLRWDDIDLDRRQLRVNQQLQRVNGRLEVLPLKTERSRRTIPLTDLAMEALRKHRARQSEDKLQAGQHWKNSGLVFVTEIGGPLEPRNVNRAFKMILKKADLPLDVRFHDLRHSAASHLVGKGVDMRTVADILGHSQITLTLDTYSHLTEGHRRKAVDQLAMIYSEDYKDAVS
jgi:integrase